jgi:hypothetical protein
VAPDRTTAPPSAWRLTVRLLPHALPIALFAGLADLFGLLMGRVGTLDQITYIWLALYVWTGTAALAAAATVVARLVHTVLVGGGASSSRMPHSLL